MVSAIRNALVIIALAWSTLSLATAAVADDTQYISERYSIPLHQGHLVWPDQYIRDDATIPGGVSPSELRARWQLFWNEHNYLRSDRGFENTVKLLDSTLTDAEKENILSNLGVSAETVRRYDGKFDFILRTQLDEFSKQDLVTAMRNAAEQGVAGRLVSEPLKVLNIVDLRLGQFDVEASVLPFAPPNLLQLDGVQVPYSDRSSWGIIVERSRQEWRPDIQLPRDEARSIVQSLPSSQNVLGPVMRRAALGVYGTLEFGERAVNFTITSIEFAYDRDLRELVLPVELSAITIDRDAEAARRQSEQAEAERQRLEAARQAQMVSFPDRDFDVLGIELGVSSSIAQAALAETYPEAMIIDANAAAAEAEESRGRYQLPELTSGEWAALCNRDAGSVEREMEGHIARARYEVEVARYEAQLEGNPVPGGEIVLSEEQYSALDAQFEQMIARSRRECVALWRNDGQPEGQTGEIELLFSATADLGGGITDHISVFGYDNSVALIVRELDGAPTSVVDSFREGLLERYGRDTHSIVSDDYFWLRTEDAHNALTFDHDQKRDCLIRVFDVSLSFVGIHTPNLAGLRSSCGPFATTQTNKMMLIDPDMILRATAAAQEAAEAAQDDTEPTIRF